MNKQYKLRGVNPNWIIAHGSSPTLLGLTLGRTYSKTADSGIDFRDNADCLRMWDAFLWEGLEVAEVAEISPPKPHNELTGGSSTNYYRVKVVDPTTAEEPYTAECNDIIEALDMNFAEGNAFKAIWRSCAARLGNGKPGTTALYDAEKVEFFGGRMKLLASE